MFYVLLVQFGYVVVCVGIEFLLVVFLLVGEVVLRLLCGCLGLVVDFVLVEFVGGELGIGYFVYVCLKVVVWCWNFVVVDLLGEFCFVFDDECVGGDVIGFEGECCFE